MKKPTKHVHSILIVLLLLVVVWFSLFGRVEKHLESKTLGLRNIVPTQIDGWELVRSDTPTEIEGLVFPNEMFQGVYYHPTLGYLILTVEYSSDSRRKYELHFPDICQAARGDRVIKLPSFEVTLDQKRVLPVALLSWEYQLRSEKALCAYWYIVGNKPCIDITKLKIKQFFADLLSKPEDTVLVRIDRSYKQTLTRAEKEKNVLILKAFVKGLYSELSDQSREVLYGNR
jgi:hypothetical protein